MTLTPDHIKLLKRLEFNHYPGDERVFIGVNGKRPFGNSSIEHDVAEILGWELPNDDLSYEQEELAEKLLSELAEALNEILRNL